MNKKILTLLIVLSIGAVSAIAIGSVKTQEALDEIDIENLDFEESLARAGNGYLKVDCYSPSMCRVNASHVGADLEYAIREVFDNETNMTLNETYHTGSYVIVQREHQYNFKKQPWKSRYNQTKFLQLENGSSSQDAKSFAKNLTLVKLDFWITNKHLARSIREEKTHLMKLQTENNIDMSEVFGLLE